jgi:ABC-type molybdate transport system ATPase subunit
MLSLFKIEHVADRYPQNMSGGEQQRTFWLARWRPIRRILLMNRFRRWTEDPPG